MEALRYLILIAALSVLLGLARRWYVQCARQADTLLAREALREIMEIMVREVVQPSVARALAVRAGQRVDLPPQIPPAELRTWRHTAFEAEIMARAGKVDEGYLQLLAGRRRALDLRDEGAVWGDELARLYQVMLNRYLRRYV